MFLPNSFVSLLKFSQWIMLFAFFLLASLPPRTHCLDLCQAPRSDVLRQAIHPHSAPRGKEAAGEYIRHLEATDIFTCAVECCHDPKCQVAWFHKQECLFIYCDPKNPRACDPVRHKEAVYHDTVMIRVRDHSSRDELAEQSSSALDTMGRMDECILSLGVSGCPGPHEVCVSWDEDYEQPEERKMAAQRRQKPLPLGICVCANGYQRTRVNADCSRRELLDNNTTKIDYQNASSSILDNKSDPETSGTNLTSADSAPVILSKTSAFLNKSDQSDNDTSQSTSTSDVYSKQLESLKETAEEFINDTSSNAKGRTLVTIASLRLLKRRLRKARAVVQSKSSNDKLSTSSIVSSSSKLPLSPKKKSLSSRTITDTMTSPEITTTPKAQRKNQTIQLPISSANLSATVDPVPKDPNLLKYVWVSLTHPTKESEEFGRYIAADHNSPNLQLSGLIAGNYTFKVEVSGPKSYGEGIVGITVLQANRKNKPPVAVIKPKYQMVQLPNNAAVLDARESTDDDKIVSYAWSQVGGPLSQAPITGDKNLLSLTKLKPTVYVFKLTVTDSNGATDTAKATVNVTKEVDYPPTSNAGLDQIINLPQNSITLYGNASKDDKRIVSWEWNKVGNELTADMQGVRTPFLTLSKLEEGDYTFSLKVTDASKQSSTSSVKVIVRKMTNSPPKANPGPARTVVMPITKVVLDGSNSSDDKAISRYQWKQISGPTIKIDKTDQVKITLTDLKVGHFSFSLTVWDKDELKDTANTTLDIEESKNMKPKANAGGPYSVTLPIDLVTLDGSHSWDDRKIVFYFWQRDDSSLSAGDIVNNSDHSAVLLLTNLIPGAYFFQLTVADAEESRDSKMAQLTVNPDPNANTLLELHLKTDLKTITFNSEKTLINQIALLLQKSYPDGKIEIHIDRLLQEPSSGNLVIIFHVNLQVTTTNKRLSGLEVFNALNKKLHRELELFEYSVARFDTHECQNNCSGHGHCDLRTKICICDSYWMSSSWRVNFGDYRSNCDWSIVYVVLLGIISSIAFLLIIWMTFCCARRAPRRRRRRYIVAKTSSSSTSFSSDNELSLAENGASKREVRASPARGHLSKMLCRKGRVRKHRYALLNEYEEKEGLRMSDKSSKKPTTNGAHSNSILETDSDFSSDEEETLFIQHRKANGRTPSANGVVHRTAPTTT